MGAVNISLEEKTILEVCERLQAGEQAAFDDLIGLFGDRFLKQVRRMLRSYPRVRRWEETDDVYQTFLIKLHRSLSSIEIQAVSEIFALAITHIRRTLIDLARHYFGSQGIGANHFSDDDLRMESQQEGVANRGSLVERKTTSTGEPATLLQWSEFHESVEQLPTESREVFELIWYAELTHSQIARILNISERTVLRRMNQARIELAKKL